MGTRGDELLVCRVDLDGSVASERQGHPMAARWRRPRRVEGQDRLPGVEREVEAAEVDVDVPLGVGVVGDGEAEAAVEGERGGHVLHDQLDDGGGELHVLTVGVPVRRRLGRIGRLVRDAVRWA